MNKKKKETRTRDREAEKREIERENAASQYINTIIYNKQRNEKHLYMSLYTLK